MPGPTHIGEPKVPFLHLPTNGDGLVYPTMVQGYEELVKEKGHERLFRSAYINRWGHCSLSLGEWLAAIESMMQRLDNGVWPSTKPEDLNKLSKSLDPNSNASYYIFRGVKKYNRVWIPEAEDFLGEPNVKE